MLFKLAKCPEKLSKKKLSKKKTVKKNCPNNSGDSSKWLDTIVQSHGILFTAHQKPKPKTKFDSIIGISYCCRRASRRIHLGLTTASTLISAIQALIWWSRNLISMVDDDLLSMVQDKSFCVRRRICCLGSKAILVSMEEKDYRIYGGRRISCQWSGNQSRISRSSGELE